MQNIILSPRGMALKLVLLSSKAIEDKETQLYQIFDSKIKQNLIKLSGDQNKSLQIKNLEFMFCKAPLDQVNFSLF